MSGMSPAGSPEQARSFGQEAELYDRARPAYPAEAVAWLVPDAAVSIVDVGAGTGKLTAALLAPGREVVAVDPDAEMLATLARRLPDAHPVVGQGEDIPLPESSADAVVFGQAWHWVDPAAASAEVGRVLKPGGTIGLIWNIRDTRVDWVGELAERMSSSAAEALIEEGGPELDAPFTGIEEATFDWERELTVDELVDLAASRSSVITAAPDERERVLGEVRELGERVAAPDGTIRLPYRTFAFRAELPAA